MSDTDPQPSTPEWVTAWKAGTAMLAQGDALACVAALEAVRRAHANDTLAVALTWEGQGRAYAALQEPQRAVDAFRQSLALLRLAKGERHPLTLGVMQNLAFALQELERWEESIALAEEACRLLEEQAGAEAPALAEALLRLSSAWYRQRDWDRAEAVLRRALAIWEKAGYAEKCGTCLNNLGRIFEERGQLEQGIRYHRQALALRQKVQGEHEDTAFSHGNLGVALATAGHLEEAVSHLQEAVAMYGRLGKGDGPEARGYGGNLQRCRQLLAGQGV